MRKMLMVMGLLALVTVTGGCMGFRDDSFYVSMPASQRDLEDAQREVTEEFAEVREEISKAVDLGVADAPKEEVDKFKEELATKQKETEDKMEARLSKFTGLLETLFSVLEYLGLGGGALGLLIAGHKNGRRKERKAPKAKTSTATP